MARALSEPGALVGGLRRSRLYAGDGAVSPARLSRSILLTERKQHWDLACKVMSLQAGVRINSDHQQR